MFRLLSTLNFIYGVIHNGDVSPQNNRTVLYNEYEGIARDNGKGTCSLIDIATSGNINVIK